MWSCKLIVTYSRSQIPWCKWDFTRPVLNRPTGIHIRVGPTAPAPNRPSAFIKPLIPSPFPRAFWGLIVNWNSNIWHEVESLQIAKLSFSSRPPFLPPFSPTCSLITAPQLSQDLAPESQGVSIGLTHQAGSQATQLMPLGNKLALATVGVGRSISMGLVTLSINIYKIFLNFKIRERFIQWMEHYLNFMYFPATLRLDWQEKLTPNSL